MGDTEGVAQGECGVAVCEGLGREKLVIPGWPGIHRIKTAGGRPAASHFFLLRQRKSNQKEGDPGLPPLRGSLNQPQASGAAQLDLAGRTPRAPLRDSNSARLNPRLLAADRGGAQGMKSKIQKPQNRRVGTLCPPFGICKTDLTEYLRAQSSNSTPVESRALTLIFFLFFLSFCRRQEFCVCPKMSEGII